MEGILFFLILPLSSAILLLLRDWNKKRRRIMAILLIANALLFMAPITYAYIDAYPDTNIWDDNGPGAVLWLYILVLPACVLAQVVMLVLKIAFAYSKNQAVGRY